MRHSLHATGIRGTYLHELCVAHALLLLARGRIGGFACAGCVLHGQTLAFIQGKELHELPQLRALLARWRFIPCVERLIEAEHRRVKHGFIQAPRSSGAYLSCKLRNGELRQKLTADKTVVFDIAEKLGSVRSMGSIIGALGMQLHPAVERLTLQTGEAPEELFQGHRNHPLVDAMVYRTDQTRFAELDVLQKDLHDKRKRQQVPYLFV